MTAADLHRIREAERLGQIGPGRGKSWTWATDLALFDALIDGRLMMAMEATGYSHGRYMARLCRVMPEIMTRDAIAGTRAALADLAEAADA